MTRPRRRYSDDNSHFGPFTLARGCHRSWGVMLDSGARIEDRRTGCHVRLYLGTSTVLLELPQLIPDYEQRHAASTWSAETIARVGRDYWVESFPREYGLRTFDGDVHIHYGPQTNDSLSTKVKVWRTPWLTWRFVRCSYYGTKGEHLRTEGGRYSADRYEFVQQMPKVRFAFEDYDGKRITAATHIEEREWRLGIRWCRWLSWFVPPRISRDLLIEFSEEVGPEKGSWKGGTVGHGITMLPGETHEAAFRRYCEQEHRSRSGMYRIKYVGHAA